MVLFAFVAFLVRVRTFSSRIIIAEWLCCDGFVAARSLANCDGLGFPALEAVGGVAATRNFRRLAAMAMRLFLNFFFTQ